MSETQFLELADGRRIAFRHLAGGGPALVFLPGYMSDMAGGKATAVMDWAAENGRECLLLDYSGCGESSGDFADGTLSGWRGEVIELIAARGIDQITLIGSSMGGWLMLMIAEALGTRMAGMIGIASAPDFTTWGFDEGQKAQLAAGETIFEENTYGYDPTPTHPGFWLDGQANTFLEKEAAIDCPVRLIHGQSDADVPWQTSLKLATCLRSRDVQVTLIKDGDHRLSRDQDIALLLQIIAQI